MSEWIEIDEGVSVDIETGEVMTETSALKDEDLFLATRLYEAQAQEKQWKMTVQALKRALMNKMDDPRMNISNQFILTVRQSSRTKFNAEGWNEFINTTEITKEDAIKIAAAATNINPEILPDRWAGLAKMHLVKQANNPYLVCQPIKKAAPKVVEKAAPEE